MEGSGQALGARQEIPVVVVAVVEEDELALVEEVVEEDELALGVVEESSWMLQEGSSRSCSTPHHHERTLNMGMGPL